MHRSSEQRDDDGLAALAEALAEIGIVPDAPQGKGGPDMGLAVFVDDRPLLLHVIMRAYCTGSAARDLIGRAAGPSDRAIPVVVADKITVEARDLLTDAGWSWLDRRGRLHLRGPGVRVDADVPAENRNVSVGRAAPIAGRGGMAVAYWLCTHPTRSPSPTRDATALGVAPSTVTTAVQRLAAAGLVKQDGSGLFPELFFELAAAWSQERAWVASVPDPEPHRPADGGSIWCRTGTAAAAAYGAPVVTVSGGPVELYVARSVEVSTAVRRYGAAAPGTGAASLAVAPTPAVVDASDDRERVEVDGWVAAPVVAVALDLAQDRSRGREILEGWDHDDAVWR